MLSENLRDAPVVSGHFGPFRESRGPFQFSIWQFLIAILVGGLALTFWRFLLNSTIGAFWIWMAVIGAAAFSLGWRAPLKWRIDASASILPRVVFVVWVVFTCFLLWVRFRWLALFWDEHWPRRWPYPDELLSQFHDWLNTAFPPPHGFLKLAGESYSVLLGINAACFLAAGASAMHFGFLFGDEVFRAGRWGVGFGKYLWQEWSA